MMSSITIDLNDNPETIASVGKFLLAYTGADTRENIVEVESQTIPTPVQTIPTPVQTIPTPVQTEAAPVQTEAAPVQTEAAPVQVQTDHLDAAGLPWDERIHSSTKSKKADGTWKMKRGVDKELVPVVEAELRAPAAPVQTETAPAAPVQTETAPAAPVQTETAPSGLTWPQVLVKVVDAQKAGTFDNDKMNAVLGKYGITGGFNLLINRPDLFETFIAEMGL